MTTTAISADLTHMIHKIYGAQLIGTLVATLLSGANTLQIVVYFRVYPEDAARLKVLIATIWGLDIVHTAFLWSDLWLYLVINFGQVSGIDAVHKPYSVPGAIVVSSTMILIVHMFYVHRIFRFSHRNYWITTPVVILALCEVASTIGAVVILYGYQYTSNFINRGYKWLFSPACILAAISDIAIMVVLLALLWPSRQHSIRLNNVIDQLVLYTFETGSLTAIMTIAMMITWLTELTEMYVGLYMSLSKVYATTLLGLLNIRHHLRHDRSLPNTNDQGHTTAIRFANPVRCSESMNPPMLSVQSPEALTGIQDQHIHDDVAKSVWIDDRIK